MTWIKTVPASEDENGRKAAEGQRHLYPIEYATPVHPTPDGESSGIVESQNLFRVDLAGVRAERDAFASLVTQLRNDTSRRAVAGQPLAATFRDSHRGRKACSVRAYGFERQPRSESSGVARAEVEA